MAVPQTFAATATLLAFANPPMTFASHGCLEHFPARPRHVRAAATGGLARAQLGVLQAVILLAVFPIRVG